MIEIDWCFECGGRIVNGACPNDHLADEVNECGHPHYSDCPVCGRYCATNDGVCDGSC